MCYFIAIFKKIGIVGLKELKKNNLFPNAKKINGGALIS
jgi:hypothetical protein